MKKSFEESINELKALFMQNKKLVQNDNENEDIEIEDEIVDEIDNEQNMEQ